MLTEDEASILLGIFCPLSFPTPSPEKRRINNDIVEILEDKKLHDFELYNLSTGFSFLGNLFFKRLRKVENLNYLLEILDKVWDQITRLSIIINHKKA